MWTQKSRKLSDHVKELITKILITEGHAYKLLKYDHKTQDRLADAIVRNGIPTTVLPKFLNLYEEKPDHVQEKEAEIKPASSLSFISP